MVDARPNETKVLDYLEATCTDWQDVALSLLSYLSDDDVRDWAEKDGYELFEEDESYD